MKKNLSLLLMGLLLSTPIYATSYYSYVGLGHNAYRSDYATATDANGNKTLSYVLMYSGSSLSDSDFSGSTITNWGYLFYGDSSSESYGTTYVTNVDFSNNTYISANAADTVSSVLQVGYVTATSGYESAVLTNVSFDDSYYSLTDRTSSNFIIAYNSTLENVSFDGTTVNIAATNFECFVWFSSTKVFNSSFTNMDIVMTGDSASRAVIGISGSSSSWGQLNNTSFYGSTITFGDGEAALLDESYVMVGNSGSQAEIQNVTWGDGKLYSTGIINWTTVNGDVYYTDANGTAYDAWVLPDNLGIILDSSDDLLTVDNNAYLDVSCTITTGTIELTNNSTLSLIDTTTLNIGAAADGEGITLSADSSNSILGGAITSTDADAIINKVGAGSLSISASMESYTGTLNIQAGEMSLTGNLGASVVTIAETASLNLTVTGNDTFSSEVEFSNKGTLVLTAGTKLEAGDYSILDSSIDSGTVIAYGGTFDSDTNTFTLTSAGTLYIDLTGETNSVEITDNSRLSLTTEADEDTALVLMDFNVSDGATVNAVSSTDLDATSLIGPDLNIDVSIAYSFDVEDLGDDETVLLSFYVGEGYEECDIAILHQESGSSEWDAADVSNVVYDGEYVSFVVSSFSSYGVVLTSVAGEVVPEPSTATLSLLALVALCARRKRSI